MKRSDLWLLLRKSPYNFSSLFIVKAKSLCPNNQSLDLFFLISWSLAFVVHRRFVCKKRQDRAELRFCMAGNEANKTIKDDAVATSLQSEKMPFKQQQQR